jgi:hypothetical protein
MRWLPAGILPDTTPSEAINRICDSFSPSASGTSDSGLPSSGRLAKTSTKQKDTDVVMG